MCFSQNKLRSVSGFSLLEVATAILVAGIGLPAIAYMFTTAMVAGSDQGLSEQAFFLANSLMNEISERRFKESSDFPGNGAENGEVSGYSRSNFNDIDDYNVFNASWGPLSPASDRSGAAISGYGGFSQWVSVVNIPIPSAPGVGSFTSVTDGSTDFKLVTVKISWNGGHREVVLKKIFALP